MGATNSSFNKRGQRGLAMMLCENDLIYGSARQYSEEACKNESHHARCQYKLLVEFDVTDAYAIES